LALHLDVETRTVFPYGVNPFFPVRCPTISMELLFMLNPLILFFNVSTSFSNAAILASRSRSNDLVCLSVMATMVLLPPLPPPLSRASRVLRRLKLEPRPMPAF
jgi:hypothetical protein